MMVVKISTKGLSTTRGKSAASRTISMPVALRTQSCISRAWLSLTARGLGIPQQVDMHCRIVRMLAQFGQVQVGPEKSDGQILADDDHDADQQGGAPDSGTGLQTVEQLC
jgi:hypothetical protein